MSKLLVHISLADLRQTQYERMCSVVAENREVRLEKGGV